MKFSILHPSARPDQWRHVFNAWRDYCSDWNQFEYILCADTRWGFAETPEMVLKAAGIGPEGPKVVFNMGRRCYVDSVNEAAKHATGHVLIVVADDQYPCERWNEKLEIQIDRAGPLSEFVLEVSTGTVKEHERGILVMPILSRARYERLGFVFYPAYESMYADNDFFEHAWKDGVVLDARNLLFPHRHPLIALESDHLGENVSQEVWDSYVSKDLWDDRYKAQHRPEAYQLGKRILEMRRRANFGPIAEMRQKIMALCIPGREFSAPWVNAVLAIQQYLMANGWAVDCHSAFSSLAYFTRQTILESVLAQEPAADYVLWLDPDNVLSVDGLKLLIADLDTYPEVQSVAGWYWLDQRDGTFRTSLGMRDSDGDIVYAPADHLAAAGGLIDISWHGFGCVLMRREVLELAGDLPFVSLPAPHSRYGMTGEDVSFCIHASERAGVKFRVDPRVFVPHLKLGSIGPAGLSKTQREPVIVACIRAKNESANIERSIRSIQPISKTVLVLDDHSSDDTALIADLLGATVYASPFAGVDEGRDRQFLLEKAREAKADFILTIDADEALDQRDLGTLVNACKVSGLDGLYLRWMHLWDSDDQIRVDGSYGQNSSPLRVFRVTPQLAFRSLSNGLHFGPVQEIQKGFCDVRLWHWGYRDQAERVRKYRFYTAQDPANLNEDSYRHIVQGDLPEVPPDVRLLKAGPLQLKKLLPGFTPVTTASGPTLERTAQQWQ